MLGALVSQSGQLIESVFELCYFYRGGLSYQEIMEMSPTERSIASKWVSTQLEKAAKMSTPVF